MPSSAKLPLLEPGTLRLVRLLKSGGERLLLLDSALSTHCCLSGCRLVGGADRKLTVAILQALRPKRTIGKRPKSDIRNSCCESNSCTRCSNQVLPCRHAPRLIFTMSDDEAFFVARNGAIWACWLNGQPAVNLGPEASVLDAMAQLVADKKGASPSAEPSALATARGSLEVASIPPTSHASREEKRHERIHKRHELTIFGRLYTGKGSRDVTILDLSESGCRFHEPHSQLKENTLVTIKIGPVGPIEASVRWSRGEHVGLQFSNPLYPSVLEHIRDHFDVRRR